MLNLRSIWSLVAEQPKSPELPDLLVPFPAQLMDHSHGGGIGWFFNGGVQVPLMYRVRGETGKYSGRSVIISSQRLGREEWTMVENEQLLMGTNRSTYRKENPDEQQ